MPDPEKMFTTNRNVMFLLAFGWLDKMFTTNGSVPVGYWLARRVG